MLLEYLKIFCSSYAWAPRQALFPKWTIPSSHHFRNDLQHPSLVRWLKLRTHSWFPLAYKIELKVLRRTKELCVCTIPVRLLQHHTPPTFLPWIPATASPLRSQALDLSCCFMSSHRSHFCLCFLPHPENCETTLIPSLVTSSTLWQGLHAWLSVLSRLYQNLSSLVFKWACPRVRASTRPV